jgi:predicted adenine nucleotide alpha hydrolase (AANH) superfamily ATPase
MKEKYWRCDICYNLRLSKAMQIAESNWIRYYTTTLSISPMKTKTKIKKFWIKNQNDKVKFLYFDFTRNWWYQKSLKLCKKYNIRRQNYCGCIKPPN